MPAAEDLSDAEDLPEQEDWPEEEDLSDAEDLPGAENLSNAANLRIQGSDVFGALLFIVIGLGMLLSSSMVVFVMGVILVASGIFTLSLWRRASNGPRQRFIRLIPGATVRAISLLMVGGIISGSWCSY